MIIIGKIGTLRNQENDIHGFGELFIFIKNIRINASNSGGLGHNHVSDFHIFLCYDLFIKNYSLWNPVRIRGRLTPTVMWTKATMMIKPLDRNIWEGVA